MKANMINEDKFKRYLLGEFFWELAQHPSVPDGFDGIHESDVEVLEFHGYDDMKVRVGDLQFDIHLSWRKDVPPDIQKVENAS